MSELISDAEFVEGFGGATSALAEGLSGLSASLAQSIDTLTLNFPEGLDALTPEFPQSLGASLTALTCMVAGVLWTRLRKQAALVAKASHEVRGPLCAVQMGLGLVIDEDTPHERVTAIELQLQRATRALDDLLAAPGRELAVDTPETCDVGRVVGRILDSLEPVSERLGCCLIHEPPMDKCEVWVDQIRLAQAVSNLVLNALEHAPGVVTVYVRRMSRCVQIEVCDFGPGLPAPLEQLVAAGRRSRSRRSHGLSVAANVAERYGGRIFDEPELYGTRLVLELPRFDNGEQWKLGELL